MKKIINSLFGKEYNFNHNIDSALISKEGVSDIAASAISRKEKIEKILQIIKIASGNVLMTPRQTQMKAAALLSESNCIEMATGEGKTLTVAMAAIVKNLLASGEKIHIVTANEYLAERDERLMRPLFRFFGLVSDVSLNDMSPARKKAAYEADVIYGTGSGFGFDFLKDAYILRKDEQIGFKFGHVLVDEIDAVLIDDAGTPLIISETPPPVTDSIFVVRSVFEELQAGVMPLHEIVFMDQHGAASLTDKGWSAVEQILTRKEVIHDGKYLYLPDKYALFQQINAGTLAYFQYKEGRDYVVQNLNIVLLDVGTGRPMPDRRLEGGAHQLLEAKHYLPVKSDSRSLAKISFQVFFKKYLSLAGLSGTVLTDKSEFDEIYGLKTIEIPRFASLRRKDMPDIICASKAEKLAVLLEVIAGAGSEDGHRQPILIGCNSVRDAELVSQFLWSNNISNALLTAKNHAKEEALIADAGVVNKVTVATNMAGRGTDIKLGGERHIYDTEENWLHQKSMAEKTGGLLVIGFERHSIRRIDDQWKGRAGRQGEEGGSVFLVSLEDDLFFPYSDSNGYKYLQKTTGNGRISSAIASQFIYEMQAKSLKSGFSQRFQTLKFDSITQLHGERFVGLRHALLFEGISEIVKNEMFDYWRPSFILDFDKKTDGEIWVDICANASSWFESLSVKFDEEMLMPSNRAFQDKQTVRRYTYTLISSAILSRILESDFGKSNIEILEKKISAELSSLWVSYIEDLQALQKSSSLQSLINGQAEMFYSINANLLFSSLCQAFFDFIIDIILSEKSKAMLIDAAVFDRYHRRMDLCPCGSGMLFKDCHDRLQ